MLATVAVYRLADRRHTIVDRIGRTSAASESALTLGRRDEHQAGLRIIGPDIVYETVDLSLELTDIKTAERLIGSETDNDEPRFKHSY